MVTGLADVLRDQGDFQGAFWLYQRALARRPDWAPTRLGLARLLFARADYPGALGYARDFIARTDGEKEKWSRYRSEAQELVRRSEGRLSNPAPPGQDRTPPEIALLSPRLRMRKPRPVSRCVLIGTSAASWAPCGTTER